MSNKGTLKLLMEYETTPCFRLFHVLFKSLITDLRENNDTAPAGEVVANQGGIRALKGVLSSTKAKKVYEDTDADGAYTP